jgi:SulP family sulfate permease
MKFNARELSQDIVAGVVIALVVLALTGSYSLLIFSGPLAEFSEWGVRITLISAVIIGAWMSWKGGFPAMVSIPQDRIAPIIGFTSAGLVASMSQHGATPQSMLATLLVIIAVFSLLTGAMLYTLGHYRLGNLAGFIPYPVVCGFLAGSGWLLVTGSIRAVTGQSVHIATLAALISSGKLEPWIACAVFGIVLFTVQLRIHHWSVFIVFLGLCAAGFYIFLPLRGISIDQARHFGWLIPRFNHDSRTALGIGDIFRLADWKQVLLQAGSFTAIAMTTIVSILLNANAIEIETEQEMDINKELCAAGVANFLSGCVGGMVGFSSLSLTRLGRNMGANSGRVGFTISAVCGICLVVFPDIVGYVPKFILGGLLLYLGLLFLNEWVVKSWSRLPHLDYLAVIGILLVIAAAGYVEGVIVGLLTATILFAVNYSRLHVVSQVLTGAQLHSNVDRPLAQQKLLRSVGHKIHIVRLQGFIFFGSATIFLRDIRYRLQSVDLEPLKFVILDFSRVQGLDSSAVISLRKLFQQTDTFDFTLIFCSVAPEIIAQIHAAGFPLTPGPRFAIHRDRDHAQEWCETHLLDEAEGGQCNHATLQQQLQVFWPEQGAHFDGMMDFLERQEVPETEFLMLQGDPADELYFIEKGKVTVQLELLNGQTRRLRTMSSGTVVGELGMYLGETRTASIVTNEPCVVYMLSRASLDRMAKENPALASAFNLFMVKLLADRLVHTSKILQSVLE